MTETIITYSHNLDGEKLDLVWSPETGFSLNEVQAPVYLLLKSFFKLQESRPWTYWYEFNLKEVESFARSENHQPLLSSSELDELDGELRSLLGTFLELVHAKQVSEFIQKKSPELDDDYSSGPFGTELQVIKTLSPYEKHIAAALEQFQLSFKFLDVDLDSGSLFYGVKPDLEEGLKNHWDRVLGRVFSKLFKINFCSPLAKKY
ncbi:MAG: hypothetical protein ACPGJV_11805 [Bacteriovoracaceae bacterium]